MTENINNFVGMLPKYDNIYKFQDQTQITQRDADIFTDEKDDDDYLLAKAISLSQSEADILTWEKYFDNYFLEKAISLSQSNTNTLSLEEDDDAPLLAEAMSLSQNDANTLSIEEVVNDFFSKYEFQDQTQITQRDADNLTDEKDDDDPLLAEAIAMSLSQNDTNNSERVDNVKTPESILITFRITHNNSIINFNFNITAEEIIIDSVPKFHVLDANKPIQSEISKNDLVLQYLNSLSSNKPTHLEFEATGSSYHEDSVSVSGETGIETSDAYYHGEF